ncbi:Mucin-associated surface protein (MASP), subgroup S039 [Trypanosoma cruzi]|nr:Mucin-associated surface protein (MASP), subgroup S039 [Trypanosoma cruzi]
MAMMMTGRVLLVCALCVLWCGAGGVYARYLDNNPVGGCVASGGFGAKKSYGKSGCGKTALTLPLRSMLPIAALQAEDEQEARELEEETTLGSVATTGPGSVSGGGHGTVGPGGAGDSGGGPNLESPSSVDTTVTHGGGGAGSTGDLSSTSQGNSQGVSPGGPKPQHSSSLEEKAAVLAPAVVEPPKNAAPAGGESVENDAQSRADDQPHLDESTKGKANLEPTEARALPGNTIQTLQGGGKAVPGVSKAKAPEPKTQQQTEPSEDKNDRNNTHAFTKSPDVPKGNNAKEGTNGDTAHTPVTPQSTSTDSQQLAAVSPSTGTPTSNEEKSTVAKETKDPQPSDNANTEKRQTGDNGKVDDSDSTTTMSEAAPQSAITITATQTNHTTNTQNSDGSTAVSHTTSPLLLLLVVACAAAAAAVVAA